ncbi:MAG: SpoIIE family protein phosphatase [Planctomycetes bacterium]|nr:SpoIIE family protein phosphatase [Planctomycetota bacterium]
MDEYFIHVEDRAGKCSVVRIDRFPFSIGRGVENDLVIPEPSVSRRHAYIRRTPEGLAIIDNQSRNGIFVNNEKVADLKYLHSGDQLRIGSSKLKLAFTGNPEIPLGSRGTETILFIPSQKNWDDPLQSLSDSFPQMQMALARPKEAGPEPVSLQQVFRLFMEAPLPEIYEHILDVIEDAVAFERCFLILFEKNDPSQIQIVAKREHTERQSEVIVSKDILRRVAQSKEAVLVTADDQNYSPTDSFIRSGAHTAICVPLIFRGQVTGVLYLDRLSSRFNLSQVDIKSLGPLAGFVAHKVEDLRRVNARIFSEVFERDLKLAKEIQERLLPQDPVSVPGYSIEGHSSSCYEVGGDYFDFIQKDGSPLTLVIGDVSGKGLPSALYMAGVQAALNAHLDDGLKIDVIMSHLERHIRRTFRSDHFLTLLLGTLDGKSGTLTYCNAGHLPPLCVRESGALEMLEATDPAFNITPWEKFTCHQFQLLPGDLLLLFTDGLIEAENDQGEMFGKDRLAACLQRHRDQDLTLIRKEIFSELDSFAENGGPQDDRTLILVRRERA